VELAKFVFRKGIDGVPGGGEDAWLHTNLGRAFLVQDDRVTARFFLEKAVELDRTGVPGLVYLSRIYLDDRNYAEAVPLLERAHERDPENHGVMVNLGLAYRGVGRLQDAERLYRQALAQLPSDPSPLMNLAILYGDYQKDYDRAVTTLREYVTARGPDAARAEEYIEEFEKEKGRAQRRRQAEEDARRREQERVERERLLREAEQGGAGTQSLPPSEPQDEAPTDTPWGEEP
jgi:tetratricopeptide (TPR) repeat protein